MKKPPKPDSQVTSTSDPRSERVATLVDLLFDGNQNRAARRLGISHSLVSRVVRGNRAPSEQLLKLLSALPGVNQRWLLEGLGEPLLEGERGTLPVSLHLLPGPPSKYSQFFSGDRHPIAPSADRISRYWYRIPKSCPLLTDPSLRPGDYLLIETDRDMLDRCNDLVHQRIAIRQSPSEIVWATATSATHEGVNINEYEWPGEDNARNNAGVPAKIDRVTDMEGQVKRQTGRRVDVDAPQTTTVPANESARNPPPIPQKSIDAESPSECDTDPPHHSSDRMNRLIAKDRVVGVAIYLGRSMIDA